MKLILVHLLFMPLTLRHIRQVIGNNVCKNTLSLRTGLDKVYYKVLNYSLPNPTAKEGELDLGYHRNFADGDSAYLNLGFSLSFLMKAS